MIQITNNIIKYSAFNGSKKQFQNAMQKKANNGKPNLGKLLSVSSIEEWQYTEADKQAMREGLKKPEECKKTIWAAAGRVRRIYEKNTQIPVASEELRKQVANSYEKQKKTPMYKNWIPAQKPQKPWTKVDALHGLAMYRLKKWDVLNPAPDTEDESDVLTHKKRRADVFSRIVTKILNDQKPREVFRVLIYGMRDYSLDGTETYYFDTFTKYENAVRAFVSNVTKIKKERGNSYIRGEITGFGKKHERGYKVYEYDQRGHMADILKPHKNKIDVSWYTPMNICKNIPIKEKTTAIAA